MVAAEQQAVRTFSFQNDTFMTASMQLGGKVRPGRPTAVSVHYKNTGVVHDIFLAAGIGLVEKHNLDLQQHMLLREDKRVNAAIDIIKGVPQYHCLLLRTINCGKTWNLNALTSGFEGVRHFLE
jgi:hypothetical protein